MSLISIPVKCFICVCRALSGDRISTHYVIKARDPISQNKTQNPSKVVSVMIESKRLVEATLSDHKHITIHSIGVTYVGVSTHISSRYCSLIRGPEPHHKVEAQIETPDYILQRLLD